MSEPKCICIMGVNSDIVRNAECPKHGNPDRRSVLSNESILKNKCPECRVMAGMPCHEAGRKPLAFKVDDHEMRFHRQRLLLAIRQQIDNVFGFQNLVSVDEFNVIYFAMVRMSDSVSASAKQVFGRHISSVEIQKFFVQKAIEELRADRAFAIVRTHQA